MLHGGFGPRVSIDVLLMPKGRAMSTAQPATERLVLEPDGGRCPTAVAYPQLIGMRDAYKLGDGDIEITMCHAQLFELSMVTKSVGNYIVH